MVKDVLQVLTEDHAVLMWLAERLASVRPGRARMLVFNELARALGAHQTIIDRTVVPALRDCGWSGLSSDVLTGHVALKRLLAETLTLEREPDAFGPMVLHLARRVGQQCDVEQRKLFPVLLGSLDDDQRAIMAMDAESHLTRLLGEGPRMLGDDGMALDAGDLVEEAYVVLGSLPGRKIRPQLQH